MASADDPIGPVLILDEIRGDRMHLAALAIGRAAPDPLDAPDGPAPFEHLASFGEITVWRARFAVPAEAPSSYRFAGSTYEIAGALGGDLRFAYVSCNGEEHADLSRAPAERNVMWRRLGEDHAEAPFALLLHGGDQVYADEVTQDHPLSAGWPVDLPDAPSEAALDELAAHLRAGFAHRYAALYAQPAFAWLAARVPSLMQWDDHDICDGWGSLPPEAAESAVGRAIFAAAREAALVFQHACRDGDLPGRFDAPAGDHLGWSVAGPGFRLVAPDLRSQRSLTRVMGATGWSFVERMAEETEPRHCFLMSSVPLLGPRLSLVERAMRRVPGIQKYEDDLRDQWQSRAHRAAWVRMLRLVDRMAARSGADVTALSGEIHLATRAEMPLGGGRVLHQLVASGIAHRPPPQFWARLLGALAALGEAPIPERPIRILPLPGQRGRYAAERNALTLTRADGVWSASWSLEHSGPTPPLSLTTGA
ncbi:alkaline phosphatase D family protein [Jannaschia formosa]|uniref:alkaline phosphatase D family protein n=1 Tax=Jannaschia formosa TaxID=2259592 RepID=UPI000E1B6D22|nr:alkaline phosphatase D family protein [Jannaschia formosa]TFL19242.1 alkaline phosphatase family protein [Jannaschia formosa]